MGTDETKFLVDEAGVRADEFQLQHPELSVVKEEGPDLLDSLNQDNIHLFAHHISMSDDRLAGKLLDELLFWRSQGRI